MYYECNPSSPRIESQGHTLRSMATIRVTVEYCPTAQQRASAARRRRVAVEASGSDGVQRAWAW